MVHFPFGIHRRGWSGKRRENPSPERNMEASGAGGDGAFALLLERQGESMSWEMDESSFLLHSFLEKSGNGFYAVSPNLSIHLWSPAMERITGIRSEEVLGRPAAEAFPFLVNTGEIDRLRAA